MSRSVVIRATEAPAIGVARTFSTGLMGLSSSHERYYPPFDWAGPSMTMDAGTWTTDIASSFSFTDPTFNNGYVAVIIDDGYGGKFVGGNFTSVTCNVTSTTYTTGYTRLVHLLPTGEVDSLWSCPVGSTIVYALALDVTNDRLFVGGNFTSIGGESRARLALVEASSGDVDIGWVCNTTGGNVETLALDVANDRLFVGGGFSSIGGELRADLALVEASSGTVDIGWTCNTTSGDVRALALDVANDRLFVGGSFTSIGGELRSRFALVEASSGTVDTLWVCDANGTVRALALDVANDRLFAGGYYTNIGGETRAYLAMVEASSGDVDTGWVCNANVYLFGLALDVANNRLFVGGIFTNIGGESRADLAMVEASSGTVDTGWVCNTGNGDVYALLSDPANDALFVGGSFYGATGLDGEQRDRFGTVVASTGDLHVP
jgi:hypothetical protein